jgi:hypothetical protein
MQSYINYLLEDIEAAKRQETPVKSILDSTESLEAHFAEIDKWVESDPPFTFSHHCGLKTEQFPPTNKLTESQMSQVVSAMDQMMGSWNVGMDIPSSVPTTMRYELILGILEKKVSISTYGFWILDFCTGNSEGCELGEYCPCLNFDSDPIDDMDNFKSDPGSFPC